MSRRADRQRDVELLTIELIADQQLAPDAARELARRALKPLADFAKDWDAAARESQVARPRRPPTA